MARYFSKEKLFEWLDTYAEMQSLNTEIRSDLNSCAYRGDGKKVIKGIIQFENNSYGSIPDWEVEHD